MSGHLHLTVSRRIDNWYQGLPDDSPLAFELHHRRRQAIRRVLAEDASWQVSDWGKTDAPEAPYAVELQLSCLRDPESPEAALPSLAYLGDLLDGEQVPRVITNTITLLIDQFRTEQRAENIGDVRFALPGGQKIRCDPDGERMLITVDLCDGRRLCFLYHATEEEIEAKRHWRF